MTMTEIKHTYMLFLLRSEVRYKSNEDVNKLSNEHKALSVNLTPCYGTILSEELIPIHVVKKFYVEPQGLSS